MNRFFAIAFFFIAFGCQDPGQDCCSGPPMVILGEPFSISVGETVDVDSSIVNVTFTKLVVDSLCPEDVECVTEGTLEVTIDINGTKENLSIGDTSRPTVEYRDYTIELQKLLFPTKEGEKANNSSTYAIQLLITRN